MPHSLGFLAGATAQIDTLPETDAGLDAVRETLRKMAAIVRKYRSDVTTVNAASTILLSCGITDLRPQKRAAINCLQAWVRDSIGYFPDPREVEMLQTPPRTLERGVGDCDDKGILLASMLESVGFETEFLAVGGSGHAWGHCVSDGELPPYSHVLAAVRFGPVTGRLPKFLDGWLTLETIVPGAGPGFKPPGIRVIMPWRV